MNNPYAQPGPYDQVGADAGVPMEPRRTSVLAIISLVLGLICCIPGLPELGVLTGIFAVVLIGGSGGRVGGRGLAIAGIFVGLLSTALQVLVLLGMFQAAKQFAVYGEIMEKLAAGDQTGFVSEFDPTVQAEITDERFEAFASEVEAEWGTFDAPLDSLSDYVSAYFDSGDQFQAMQDLQNPQSGILPIPVRYSNGTPVVFFFIPQQNSGMPIPLNAAVPLQDGSALIWLLPDGAGASSMGTPPATPAPADGEGEISDAEAAAEDAAADAEEAAGQVVEDAEGAAEEAAEDAPEEPAVMPADPNNPVDPNQPVDPNRPVDPNNPG